MKPCQMSPYGSCAHEATVSLRVYGVGDISVCQRHHEWMVEQGMDLRVLDSNAFKPEWTQRMTAKDMTGRVLA